jgi:hypothetical protein
MAAPAAPVLSVVKTSSPAREHLARINGQVGEIREAIAAALKPITALHAAGARLVTVEQKLAASRSIDDEALSSWLEAGREGPRPEPSHETLRLEAAFVEAKRDRGAAEAALPLRQSEVARRQEELARVVEQQTTAVNAVVVEIVQARIPRMRR